MKASLGIMPNASQVRAMKSRERRAATVFPALSCILAAAVSLRSVRAAAAQSADQQGAHALSSAAHSTEADSNAVASGPVTNAVSGEPPRSAEDLSLTNSLVASFPAKNALPAQ